MTTTTRLVHRPDCAKPKVKTFVGRENGDLMASCSSCNRLGRADQPPVPPAPAARYYLGECCRCTRELWTTSRQPRKPICDGCIPGGVPVLAPP